MPSDRTFVVAFCLAGILEWFRKSHPVGHLYEAEGGGSDLLIELRLGIVE